MTYNVRKTDGEIVKVEADSEVEAAAMVFYDSDLEEDMLFQYCNGELDGFDFAESPIEKVNGIAIRKLCMEYLQKL